MDAESIFNDDLQRLLKLIDKRKKELFDSDEILCNNKSKIKQLLSEISVLEEKKKELYKFQEQLDIKEKELSNREHEIEIMERRLKPRFIKTFNRFHNLK